MHPIETEKWISLCYGFIRIDDALRSNWIVEDRKGNLHRYRSVEDLVDAGWAMD